MDVIPILPTAESDILKITRYLRLLDKSGFLRLGMCLGLEYSSVKDLLDSKTYREDVIAAWLRRKDNVEKKSGVPTWRTLVKALKNPQVKQEGIAGDIEKNITTDS